jgi:hypothetical protein
VKSTPRVGYKVFDFWYLLNNPSLKREILYFDSLATDMKHFKACLSMAELLCTARNRDPSEVLGPFLKEFEYLQSKDLIRDMPFRALAQPVSEEDLSTIQHAAQSAARAAKRSEDPSLNLKQKTEAMLTWAAETARSGLLRARAASVASLPGKPQLIPFLSGDLQRLWFQSGQISPVLHVVLHHIPVPGEDVAWEKILEFRDDSDTKRKLAALRGWMAGLSDPHLSVAQLEDKLEAALADYRQHMHINRMKHSTATLEAILVPVAEVLESLTKLQFSKLVKSVFSLTKEDISLLEAEASAPGKELAYLEKVQAAFAA